jgi:2-polyprenyl-6-methoxyphenol hydroxylase-like FAD-dependent oxidoreductase
MQVTPLGLGQESMERIMCEHLAARYGIQVERGTEVVGFDQNADFVTARLRKITSAQNPPTEETLVVQYLVGSDGGHSFVRHHLGLAFPGKGIGETLIYGDVSLKGLDEKVRAKCGEASLTLI